MTIRQQDIAALLGRLLLSTIFLMSGVHKFTDWTQTAQQMEDKGIVAVPVMLPLAALAETGGGLLLLFGLWTRVGALALIAFLIPTTVIFHAFWSDPGQTINFMKNLAIMGGLFSYLAHGPGGFSVDAYWPLGATRTSARETMMLFLATMNDWRLTPKGDSP